jgi:predicted dehydrogenase
MNSVRKFRVFQKDQYLSIDFEKGELSLTTRTGEWKEGQIPLEHNSWSLSKSDAIMEEAKAFLNSIQNNSPVTVPGEDGVKALQLAETILEDIQRRHI